MDVHVRGPVTTGLRLRGIDVLTAQEDDRATCSDSDLLDRAGDLGRPLFSQDEDLLREAAQRQSEGISFGGVVYAHQQNISVRRTIDDLQLLAKALNQDEIANRVIFLPLK
jgi:hypothetical protein